MIKFLNDGHKSRFSDLAARTGGKVLHIKEYTVAVYMLAGIEDISRKAAGYMDSDGINFQDIIENNDLSSGELLLVKAAHELFGWCKEEGFDLSDVAGLSDDYFQIVLSGIMIARGAEIETVVL